MKRESLPHGHQISDKIATLYEGLKGMHNHHELFVVVGGGKPAREYIGIVRKFDASEALCDDIGIEVTRLNAKLLVTDPGRCCLSTRCQKFP